MAKFPLFQEEINLRQKNADFYTLNLNKNGITTTPIINDENSSVFAQYTIQVSERELIQKYLKENNVPSSVHYPLPLNDQPAFKNKYKYRNSFGETSICKRVSQKVLSIPMHPWLSQNEKEKVIRCLTEAVNNS